MAKITLSISEQALAKYIAKQRQENKERGNIKDRRAVESQDPYKLNLYG